MMINNVGLLRTVSETASGLISDQTGNVPQKIVEDEDDLKWVINAEKILLLLEQFRENFHSKHPIGVPCN